jgi:hypothetical protein
MPRKSASLAIMFATATGLASIPASAADVNAEITTAATHAGLAAQASDIATVHTHLHHTINCLVGPGGQGFDAKELNPCANSGSGAIPDSTSASSKQALQGALVKANNGLAATDLATAQAEAKATSSILKTVK